MLDLGSSLAACSNDLRARIMDGDKQKGVVACRGKQAPSRGFFSLVVLFFAFLMILYVLGRGIFFCEEYLEEAYVVFLSLPIGVYFFRGARAALTHRLSNEHRHHHGTSGSFGSARLWGPMLQPLAPVAGFPLRSKSVRRTDQRSWWQMTAGAKGRRGRVRKRRRRRKPRTKKMRTTVSLAGGCASCSPQPTRGC